MKIQESKSKITEVKVSIDGPKDRFEMTEVRNRELTQKSLKSSNPQSMKGS